MWKIEKSLSYRVGKRSFLEEGGTWTVSQRQEQVEGTEQGARPEEMSGSKWEEYSEDTETRWHRKAGGAECSLPSISRQCGSSGFAWGLQRGVCPVNVGRWEDEL